MNPYDYSRSFVTFVTPNRANNARLQIQSRCILTDTESFETKEYCFYASCKSEATFAKKNLFYDKNYDFCGIFEKDEYAIFRAHAEWTGESYTQRGLWRDFFQDVVWQIHEAANPALLETNESIMQATLAGAILVGRTEIENEDGTLAALIEFPIKTMNVNDIRNEYEYQVDTGPIPFPVFEREVERHIDRFELAYVAYNVPHFADFVIQGETELGSERATHYSQHRRDVKAKNSVIRVGNVNDE